MKKILLILKFILFLILNMFVLLYKIDTSEKLSDFLSFLSISIGFCLTSLTLIATTKFSKNLYERRSTVNNKTLLHELVDKFQEANLCFFAIIFIIFSHIVLQKTDGLFFKLIIIFDKEYSINTLFQSQVIFLMLIGLRSFFELISIVGQYVIQSSKSQN